MSIIMLAIIPFLHNAFIRVSLFKPIMKIVVFSFCAICVLLTYIGAKPIEMPYLWIGQISTILYFAFFVLLLIIELIEIRMTKMVLKD